MIVATCNNNSNGFVLFVCIRLFVLMLCYSCLDLCLSYCIMNVAFSCITIIINVVGLCSYIILYEPSPPYRGSGDRHVTVSRDLSCADSYCVLCATNIIVL